MADDPEPGVIEREEDAPRELALPPFAEGLGPNAPVLYDAAAAFLPIPVETIRDIGNMLAAMPGAEKVFNSPEACQAIVLQAALWRVSPIFLLRGAYQAKAGATIGYEAKVLQAVILANGPFSRRPRLSWGYADPNKRIPAMRFCRVTYWVIGEEEPFVYTSPTVAQIKIKNSPEWFSDLDRQLGYYATRAGANLYFPDVLGGVYSREDVVYLRSLEAPPPRRSDFEEDDQPVEAEFSDRVPPNDADLAAYEKAKAKAEGGGDSRDPRDAPLNKGSGPSGRSPPPDDPQAKGAASSTPPPPEPENEPEDLAEVRAWAGTEQRRILTLTTPSLVSSAWTRMTDDKQWGRLKAYDQPTANLIGDTVRAHHAKLKGGAK